MEVMIEKDIDKSVTNSQQIVTFVHGTWAHDADWMKSDSKIYRRLEQLGPNTLIQSFQWSGNNSHNARLKAANKLSKKITDTASKYPDAKQLLISHSHGGNVVLYALRDPKICRHISSVVCLATPFIRAQPRPLEPAMFTLRSLVYSATFVPIILFVTALLIIMSIAVLFFPEAELASYIRNLGVPRHLLLFGLVIVWGLFFWAGRHVSHKLNGWINSRLRPFIESYQKKLMQLYGHYTAQVVPVLNLQVKGDEAAWWLRALIWASEARENAASIIKAVAIFTSVFGIAMTRSFIEDGLLHEIPANIVLGVTIIILATFLVWLVLLPIFIVISHVIFIGMPLLFRAHSGGFGEWSIVANWLLKIDAYTEPATDFEAESIQFTMKGTGLRHSQIYQDDRIIECIVKWMNKN
jgi:hypothetical protein